MDSKRQTDYDPRTFEEDDVINAEGLVGWLASKRKSAIVRFLSKLDTSAKSLRVLDVGCGYGDILSLLKATEKVGIDANFKALKRAKEKDSAAIFIQCDGQHLPFRPMVFDGLVCSEVLEHVDDPSRFASEMIAVVKPDGLICLTVPNEAVTTLGRLLLNKRPYKSPAHRTNFTLSKLKKVIDQPLVRKKNIPFGFLPFFISANFVALFRKTR
jgi:ubiquinone/menaquinone biosynthesis C-methylase UbiE